MKGFETQLKDCWVLEPDVFEDERGYFFEGFNAAKFNALTGLTFEPKQLNQSKSEKGVLRGLHFQHPPKAQAKLVTCLEGEILDVAVDLRKDSNTFGEHFMVRLSEENKKHFFIPKGFAHGFLVLTENARLMYQVDEIYSPEHDDGIYHADSDLNISWGFDPDKIILSEKDKNLKRIKDTILHF
ncbi:MAG: dTDP-4-dehydrorhamnose 3,5-epimerase [Ekhidna sp.]